MQPHVQPQDSHSFFSSRTLLADTHTHTTDTHTHTEAGFTTVSRPKKEEKKDRSLVNSGQRSRPDSDGDDNGLRAAGADGAVLAMRGTVPHWV